MKTKTIQSSPTANIHPTQDNPPLINFKVSQIVERLKRSSPTPSQTHSPEMTQIQPKKGVAPIN